MGLGAGLYMYDVVVKQFTFAISSPDEFLLLCLRGNSTNNSSNSKLISDCLHDKRNQEIVEYRPAFHTPRGVYR